jgi:hypothetical protein
VGEGLQRRTGDATWPGTASVSRRRHGSTGPWESLDNSQVGAVDGRRVPPPVNRRGCDLNGGGLHVAPPQQGVHLGPRSDAAPITSSWASTASGSGWRHGTTLYVPLVR